MYAHVDEDATGLGGECDEEACRVVSRSSGMIQGADRTSRILLIQTRRFNSMNVSQGAAVYQLLRRSVGIVI